MSREGMAIDISREALHTFTAMLGPLLNNVPTDWEGWSSEECRKMILARNMAIALVLMLHSANCSCNETAISEGKAERGARLFNEATATIGVAMETNVPYPEFEKLLIGLLRQAGFNPFAPIEF